MELYGDLRLRYQYNGGRNHFPMEAAPYDFVTHNHLKLG
jgi:hypothetical protein